jgi:cytochrome c nitrite reductase small subunit
MLGRLQTLVVAASLVGLGLGVGAYTFVYAKGYSYLTDNPAACMNCHVMREQYDAWLKSSHRAVATCNDCHTPHNPVGKYTVKALNGFFHSFAFTSGWYPDVIEITPRNAWVTEGACRSCHGEITAAISGAHRSDMACVRCHANVGHSAASFVMSTPSEGVRHGTIQR